MDKPQGIYRYLPWNRSRLRTWLVAGGIVAGLMSWSQPTTIALAVAGLFLVTGFLMHFICKAHLIQNEVLTLSGPYQWVRHPFYLANFMIDFGLCMVVNRWAFTAVYFLFWSIAYYRQMRKEESFLLDAYGERYRTYMKQVPMLFPWTFSPFDAEQETEYSLSNDNIARGKEGPRLLRYSSYPFLFLFCSVIGEYGFADVMASPAYHLVPFAFFVSLYGTGYVSKRFAKQKTPLVPAFWKHYGVRLTAGIVFLLFLTVTDGYVSEVQGDLKHYGIALSCVVYLLVTGGAFLRAETYEMSGRFQIFLEMGLLLIGTVISGLYHLMVLPVLSYVPILLEGNEVEEDPRLDTPIMDGDPPLVSWGYKVGFVLFQLIFLLLAVQEFYGIDTILGSVL